MDKFWVEADYTNSDIGEVIELIRTKKLDMSIEECAKALGCKVPPLKSAEEGKGAHMLSILGKILKAADLKATISITEK